MSTPTARTRLVESRGTIYHCDQCRTRIWTGDVYLHVRYRYSDGTSLVARICADCTPRVREEITQ